MTRKRARQVVALVLASVVLAATGAAAEAGKPAPAIEGTAGYAGFVDEVLINHLVVGAAGRVHLTPRISVGPEVVYMIGPGGDRDLFVTGNLTVDLLRPPGSRPRRVVPYLLAGAGLMNHREMFVSGPFFSNEVAVTGGGGVRVAIGDQWYVAPEFRLGWELHLRTAVSVGYRVTPGS